MGKKLEQFLEVLNHRQVVDFKQTPINAREGLANLISQYCRVEAVEHIFDDIVMGPGYDVPVRIYLNNRDQKQGVIIYFHGGGHMAGSVSAYDPICRKLANETNKIVISVEYRRSPENPYPACLEDAKKVRRNYRQVLDNWQLNYSSQIILAGDSGGGSIATSLSMFSTTEEDLKFDMQLLIYPAVDYTLSCKSIDTYATGYLLHSEKIRWYYDNYFQNNEDRRAASPLFGPINNNIGPTLIISADHDPIFDEQILYEEKLKTAGIKVKHNIYPGMIHTFACMQSLVEEEYQQVFDEMNEFIKENE